jgi:hypothetical protein
MNLRAKIFGYIFPIIVVACPSISHASDAMLCKPTALAQCLRELPGSVDICVKRACEKKQASSRSAPRLRQTEAIADVVTPSGPPPAPPFAGAEPPAPQPQAFFLRADRLDNL